MLKSLTVWLITNWKILKRYGNTRPPYLPPEKTCMYVKMQQLEPDVGKQTGSKLRKKYVKVAYCHLLI